MSNLTKEEQFNNLFNKYGNRLITNDNSINQFRITARETISKYTNLDIYFDIIDEPRVNAVASKLNDSYFIAIFSGTIQVFDYLIRKICAHPNILTEFGNSSKECKTTKVYNAVIKNSIHIIEENPPVKPVTKERNRLSQLIFTQAVLNIIFHELGHIVNGHLNFLQLSKINYIEEVQIESTKLSSLESLDRQTLEIDADAFSAIETLRELFTIFNSQEYQDILPCHKSIFKLWSFTRQICWRVMENNYIDKKLLEITHPPTGIRFQYTKIACLDLIKKRGGQKLVDIFEISYESGVYEADEALQTLSEKEQVLPPVLSEKLSTYHFTHGAIIFCHWDTIRVSLLPLDNYCLREPNIYDSANEILEVYQKIISNAQISK
ncbi:hypothetical protein [Chryseobacterium flavum]|uniref:hypothetical protein n=1 Tax=Chryseobacterium flavum TaxID=415851 RepID=UPI002FDB2438